MTQRGADFIASHMRAFEYIGGVTVATVCDQLRSGVSRPCRYEPQIQRTYEAMASHYGTTVLPARPRSPRDKAKVEVGVQIAERWILARLRNEEFAPLEALNARIAELLEDLNGRVMRRYSMSRRELFERSERAHLRPLPSERFAYCSFERATINIDYHVAFDDHFYSVPCQLRYDHGPVVELRVTAGTIEVLHKNRRVASHARSYAKHQHTTIPRAHARSSSAAARVDAVAAGVVGRHGRRQHAGAGREDSRESAASRAGLPHLPRPASSREDLRR